MTAGTSLVCGGGGADQKSARGKGSNCKKGKVKNTVTFYCGGEEYTVFVYIHNITAYTQHYIHNITTLHTDRIKV